MFCKYCGSKIDDHATFCPYCSKKLETTEKIGENKKPLGFLLFILLNIIGLIIGLCAYPFGSTERKTFLNGWLAGLFIALVIGVAVFLFLLISLTL